MTSSVNRDDIITMSSPPRVANQNYFFVNDYDDLADMEELVALAICNRLSETGEALMWLDWGGVVSPGV